MKRKYVKGKFGLSSFMKDNSDLISSGTNFASGALSALDAGNEFGNKSTGTNIGSSALSGAGLGMTVGGPIGAGIGAVAGGLYGLFTGNQQRKEEQSIRESQDKQEKSNLLNSYSQKVRTNPELINGSKNNQYYATGGETNLIGSKSIGGNIHQLTSNDSFIHGKSHEEGGVKFPNEGVELEGGETMNDSFVFSKELGFADKHLSLIKNKAKIEKSALQRPNDDKLINGLELINKKVENLKKEQELTKAKLGIENDLEVKAKGGLLDRDYLLGTNDEKEELQETKFKELNFNNSFGNKPDKKKDTESDSFFLSGSYNQKAKQGNEVQETTKHLRSSGLLSDNAVKGILGNISRESGFNPNAVGDNGNSFGLVQHNKERKNNLLSFLKSQGLPSNSIKGQLDFTLSELKQTGLINQLNNAKTPEEASDIFVSKFERPANINREIGIRRNLTKQYSKMRNGGLLKGKFGLTPEELRTKKLQEEYTRRTGGKDYRQLEKEREKEAVQFGINSNIKTDKEIERRKQNKESLRKEGFSRYKVPNINISGKFKPESTGVNNSRYNQVGNISKTDGTKATANKTIVPNDSMSKSLNAYKSAQTLGSIKNQYNSISDTVSRRIDEGTENLKNTGRKISDFFSSTFSNSDKSNVEQSIKDRGKGNTSNVGRKIEPYAQNRDTINKGSSFKFSDLFPDAPKNSASGANPVTGLQYNQSKKIQQNSNDGSSYKSDAFKQSNQQKNTPFEQNRKLSDLLMNKNKISDNNNDDGSSYQSDAFAKSQKNKNNTTVTQSKTRPLVSKNTSSKNSNTGSKKTITPENKTIEKQFVPTTAGGDRFTQKPTMFNIDKEYTNTALSKEELANQRKGQVKMLSDDELKNSGTKKGLNINIDKDKITNGLNQYGSDIVGLMRKYPNEPAPVLNSDVSLSRVNMNENRATNERDFSKVKRMAEANGSSNYGSVLGGLYGKKLEANNQIAQAENNANTQISNQEALANNQIRANNNSLTNDYNSRKYNRNIDIQNANQGYLSNINEKALLGKREQSQAKLDLAKLGVSYLSLDNGVTKKADSVLGNEIREQSTNAFKSLLPKKKILPSGRNGGLLKTMK